VSRRRAAHLAWASCALCVLLMAVAVVFTLLSRSAPEGSDFTPAFDIALGFALLAFPLVGAVVVSRLPENYIGWLFCAVGLPFGLSGAAHGWAVYALVVEPGALPGADWAAWIATWAFVPPLFAIPPLLFVLFPDGRPASRRWRPVVWLTGAGVVATTLGTALAGGNLEEPPFKAVANPAGLDGAGALPEIVSFAGFVSLFVAILLGAVALVSRFTHARGDERQQLKWFSASGGVFALACVLFVAPFSPLPSDTAGQAVILLAFCGIPVAAGVAILKHRLYDIDVVINRALVYGALTATLIGAYAGSVLLLQLALSPLTEQSDLAIAGSTLAVAALFGPARKRIQALVDRRFYRRRYDAARTLESFGGRLREEVDLDALGADLRAVVAEAVQPAHVSLWLRSS
jgi:hypothetical protein